MEQGNKGNINPSNTKVDIKALSEEMGIDEKFLNSKLSGDETTSEALIKIAKDYHSAQGKITEQGQLLKTYKDKMESFAQTTIAGETAPETKEDGTPVKIDMSKVDELVAIMEDTKKYKSTVEEGLSQAEALKTELSAIQAQSQSATTQLLGRFRAQQYKEGYNSLETRVGEEIAKKYFDLENPDNSIIGQILSGKVEGNDDEKEWAINLKKTAQATTNPIAFIFNNVATEAERMEFLSNQPPQTEGSGGRTNLGQDAEVKEFEEFFGLNKK
jgi:hypothetical protein